jgi:hypothetical protein
LAVVEPPLLPINTAGVGECLIRLSARASAVFRKFPGKPCAVFEEGWGSLRDAVSLGKHVLEGREFLVIRSLAFAIRRLLRVAHYLKPVEVSPTPDLG